MREGEDESVLDLRGHRVQFGRAGGRTCTPDRVPVVRLYNNGMGGQASHRYVTSHSEVREMTQRGWIVEGNVFCAIP